MTTATTRREQVSTVIEVNEATFERDIVQRSHQLPVVIDFWAPWCGPCRTLGPTLEKLANEANGAWLLAKINVDDNPRLAQAFGVQGIPAVKALRDGKLVDEFTGALPESRVREWLKGIAVSAGTLIEEDLDAMEQSNPQEAIKRYRAAIAAEPTNAEPRLKLGRMLVMHGEPEGATLLQAVAQGTPQYSEAQALITLAGFLAAEPVRHIQEGWSSDVRYHQAAQFARQKDYPNALDALLEIVARDRGYRDDGGRKTLLALLTALGDQNPLTGEYRRKLANVLF